MKAAELACRTAPQNNEYQVNLTFSYSQLICPDPPHSDPEPRVQLETCVIEYTYAAC